MKTRFRTAKVRTGLFASKEVVVLQILRKYKDGPDDSNGLPTYLAGEAWEDAKVEDLFELRELTQ